MGFYRFSVETERKELLLPDPSAVSVPRTQQKLQGQKVRTFTFLVAAVKGSPKTFQRHYRQALITSICARERQKEQDVQLTAAGENKAHRARSTKTHTAIHFRGPRSRHQGHSCVQQQLIPNAQNCFLDMQETVTRNAESENYGKQPLTARP